ncbi:MAG: sigma-70 family RNA polymerase sigma factor [Acidobacteriota bacterium]
MGDRKTDVTRLLDAWSGGDPAALDQLVPLVVGDLRKMARAQLARETPGHTLQPTGLVNELYLKLIGKRSVQWQSRTQFFATMSQLMRRILVDHARRRAALKKGGDAVRVTFDRALDVPGGGPGDAGIDIVALDEALERLAEMDPRQARVVELRYFGGLTLQEAATSLDVSTMTVKREWRTARLWLLHELGGGGAAQGHDA